MLQLKLLGQIECRLSTKSRLMLPTRKAEVLLSYLALAPGVRHPRERLINLLWSNRSEEQARNSLRQALSAIKKTLTQLQPLPLEIDRTTVRLDPGLIGVDALEFERLSMESDIESLSKAASLYQGEFLEGISIRDAASQEWLAHERDRFKRIIVDLLIRLSRQHVQGGEYALAIESAERLVDYDPLQETGWQILMQAYNGNSERNHALLAYKRCHEILAHELGVEPEPATTEIWNSIRDGRLPEVAKQPVPDISDPEQSELVSNSGTDQAQTHSILVLPFDNLSNDSEQKYFSEGITEGIIVGLSVYPSLTVLSRHYSFAIRDQKLSISKIAEKFDVRYIIEGSVRKTPGKIRITAQLVNTRSGEQVWGKRFDSDLEDIFSIEDELTRTIVANIKGRIDSSDEHIAYRKPARDMSSYDLLMQGKYHLGKFNPDHNQLGRSALEKCIEIDPDCAIALNYLYRINILDWLSGWTEPRKEMLTKAGEHIEKAIQLAPDESVIQASYAEYLLFTREYDRSADHAEHAFRLNPNDTETLATLSTVHAGLGNVELALEMADNCRTLDPFHPWIDWVNGIAYYTGKRYQDALDTFKLMPNPADEIEGWIAACYEKLGQHTAAEKHLQNYVETVRQNMSNPPTTLEDWHKLWQATSASRHDYNGDYPFNALCEAGLEQYIEQETSIRPTDNPPAIVVLPFDNLSGDRDQEYFSDGITESIILNLSMFPDLIVKSRNSSFAFKEQLKSVGEISNELNVDYVVEGSIRKSVDRIRITVQLVEATHGNQVWGKRYDSRVEELFDLEEDLSRTIAATVTGRIESDRQKTAIAKSTEDQKSYDLLLAGIHDHYKLTPEGTKSAREKLYQCLERDPKNTRAHSYLYASHILDWMERWSADPDESFRLAGEHAAKALQLDPDSIVAILSNAEWMIWSREYDKSESLINRTLAISPNNPEILASKGFLENMLGKFDAGMRSAAACMELDPYHPWGNWIVAESLFNNGENNDAIEVIQSIIESSNAPAHVRIFLIVCYMKIGETEKAESLMAEFLEQCRISMKSRPETESEWREWLHAVGPMKDMRTVDDMFTLLMQAGLCDEITAVNSEFDKSNLPAICVLPFDNLSGDPEQEYFSDGITDSIILNLSMFNGMIVKSRHSSFAYKNSGSSIADIADELGIQYAVEGSIRKAASRVRINVQLIESRSGNQLWGKRYDAELEDIFDLEQELSLSIAGAISGKIGRDIERIALKKPTSDLRSYDYFMRGRFYLQQFKPEDLTAAKEQFEKSLEIDPDYADAHSMLCTIQDTEIMENWTENRGESLRKSGLHAKRALELDPENAFVHAFMAEHLFYQRDFESGEHHADRAIELNPTLPDGYSYKAWALSARGKTEQALKYADLSVELDPHHPYTGWIAGEVYRNVGEYELAIKAFKSMHHPPPSVYGQITACLAGLDRIDEARAEMKLYLGLARKHMPNYPATEEQWRSYWYDSMPYRYDENSEKLFELLLKAGLCELTNEPSIADNPIAYPAIAVLPFNNLSGDPEQEYFSDGISEAIILGLSMYKGLVTKSSYASFAYRQSEKSISEIAGELQVQYLVDGSVRKSGNRVRIAAQLIESGTGNQIWGKHYDAEPDDILDLERELSKTIVGNISSRIDHDIHQSVIRKPVSDLTSYDYFMRAQYHAQKFTRADLVLSTELLGKAIEMDKNNAIAYTFLAGNCYIEYVENWTMDRQESLARAKLNIDRALELEPDNAIVHGFMSEYFLLSREHERAEFHADKSMELNSTLPDGYAFKSWALAITGKSEEALDYAKMCFQLDPHHPYAPWMVGEAYRESGEFDQAIKVFRSLPHIPTSVHVQIAMCLAGLGEIEQAKTEMQHYQELAVEQMPNYPTSIEAWRAYWSDAYTYKYEKDLDKSFDLLLKAGLGDYVMDNSGEVPSLAVLPFENMSGDPEQEYFSDGITNDIISTLSRFRNMRVVALHSTYGYKERKASISEIAAEQDARYILEGRIRKSGQKIRITAELIDSNSESVCWNETYDRNLDDIFAVQDELTMNIVAAMRIHLTDGETARYRVKKTTSLKAWEYTIRTSDLGDTYIQDNLTEARRLIETALEEDPSYSLAWANLGWINWQEAYIAPVDSMAPLLKKAETAVEESLALDSDNTSAILLQSFICMLRGQDPDPAIAKVIQAASIAPGDVEVLGLSAYVYFYAGRSDEALEYYKKAIRLSPIQPNWLYLTGGCVYQQLGQMGKAIELYQNSVNAEPDSPLTRYFLVDACMEAGQMNKARQIADEIRALDHSMNIGGAIIIYSHDARERERLRGNLAKMGFTG